MNPLTRRFLLEELDNKVALRNNFKKQELYYRTRTMAMDAKIKKLREELNKEDEDETENPKRKS